MIHLLLAIVLLLAISGAFGENFFNRKKRKANDSDEWDRYHKYATWCKIGGITFALITGFLAGQVHLR